MLACLFVNFFGIKNAFYLMACEEGHVHLIDQNLYCGIARNFERNVGPQAAVILQNLTRRFFAYFVFFFEFFISGKNFRSFDRTVSESIGLQNTTC